MTRPLPDLQDPQFAEHWVGLSEGRVRIRRCRSCGRHSWPPRPTCQTCYGFDHEWVDVEPHGRLYSWTVVGHATLPGFEPPYAVVLVELLAPVGVRLLGSYQGDPAGLSVGQPLTARPVQVTDGVHLLSWSDAETTQIPDDTSDAVATDTTHDTEVGEHQ